MGWEMPWYSARDSLDALLAGRGFGGFLYCLRDGDRAFETWPRPPGSLGESHPQAPTERNVTVSRHSALLT
jgi:hypothetical protein